MNEMQFFSNERCFPNPKFLLWGFYKNQSDRPLHKQEFAEIVFVLSGESDYLTARGEDTMEHISRGSILIVPEGGMHGYYNCRDLKIFALLFTPSHLPLVLSDLYSQSSYQQVFGRQESYYENVRKNYPRLDLSDGVFADFEYLLKLLVHFQDSTTPGSNCERLGVFMCIIGQICDIWQGSAPKTPETKPLDMDSVISYIQKNINENFSLETLAAMNSMSVNTLLRHFRRTFGRSPVKYMQELRMKTAAELLLNTNMRVKEIADQFCFTSSAHFIAAFKKFFGVTPNRFRIDNGSREV